MLAGKGSMVHFLIFDLIFGRQQMEIISVTKVSNQIETSNQKICVRSWFSLISVLPFFENHQLFSSQYI